VPLRDLLYARVFGMSHNQADAEGPGARTVMSVHPFDSFRSGTNLNAWLLRILTNTYINGYRRKRRHRCSTHRHLTISTCEANARSPASALRSAEDHALTYCRTTTSRPRCRHFRAFSRSVYYADVEGLRYKEICGSDKHAHEPSCRAFTAATTAAHTARWRRGQVGPQALPLPRDPMSDVQQDPGFAG